MADLLPQRVAERAFGADLEHVLRVADAAGERGSVESVRKVSTRVAERISEKAKESDVPVHEDAKLAATLGKLEIGDMIPPELYEVVAEVLIFVDGLDKIRQKMEKQ